NEEKCRAKNREQGKLIAPRRALLLASMQAEVEPSVEISGLEQRSQQVERDPAIAAARREREDQVPLGPEGWEWRQTGDGADKQAKEEDRAFVAEQRPILDVVLADIARKPKQARLGEEVIEEQAADDERDCRFGVEHVQQRQRHRHEAHLPDRRVAEE